MKKTNGSERIQILVHRSTRAELLKIRKGHESFDDTVRRLLKLKPVVKRRPGPKPKE